MNTRATLRRPPARPPRARNARALAVLLVTTGALALLCAPANAEEEETHVFNATLSLTGDCITSELDPVPDPGCPGGAHPPKPFVKPGGVAVDLYGNRYVASAGGAFNGSEGRIDVFDSSGEFITEIAVALREFKASLAVDSQGYLYLAREFETSEGDPKQAERVLRYAPTKYNPAAGEIEYGAPPVAISNPDTEESREGQWADAYLALAVNPADDHLFVEASLKTFEFASAAEGNGFEQAVSEYHPFATALAIDSVRDRLYVTDVIHEGTPESRTVVKIFDLEAPHELIGTIDGSTTPTGRFVSLTRGVPVAVDEATGHVFVGDLESAPTKRVYEFDLDGSTIVSTIEHSFTVTTAYPYQLAYDDSPTSPTQGYLFVASGANPGRSYAFQPKPPIDPPVVEGLSVTGITSEEAILHGKVNPGGLETAYRIEYTSEEEFKAQGFAGAALAGEGTLKVANEGLAVSAPVSGLSPGTAYRFRLAAENELGTDEADAAFATYTTPVISNACPNQALRSGPSALLPDCRAYELVTPADTNGHAPFAQGTGGPPLFLSRLFSPEGDRLSFKVEAGIPSIGNTGSRHGDPYLATRGEGGWQTEFTGPSAAFAPVMWAGSSAPDQTHLVWQVTGPGPALLEGSSVTTYIRYPDGHSEVLGQGSLATDPSVDIKLIAENASHILFRTGGNGNTPRQLEPNAPPDGTYAIYDRTADGVLHVVSLLPGEVTPEAGQNAGLRGASLDGEEVAFEIGNTLYLRHRNEATYAIGEGVEFAGLAEGGEHVFYMQGGDLYRFNVQTEEAIPFSESGDVTPVNVATDGSAAYFLSPSVLTGEPNPSGEEPQVGKQNLYLSREGQLSFVGVVTDRDVEGEFAPGIGTFDGLGLWLEALAEPPWGALAQDPSRTTPDGGVLLFESSAPLTAYDPEGHAQVYRYDSVAGTLACLSCNPTGAPATGEGDLQSISYREHLLSDWNPVNNLRADGARAFFESTEQLVLGDTDGLTDVYEWEEEGVGECETQGGCLYLISSGQSGRDDLLYAVSDSGDDVFFRSADLLLSADPNETPSIYDARVNGGFPPPQSPAGECLGEACQPAAVAPDDPTPASSAFEGAGNVKKATRPRCPKGKRAVRSRGKTRCVPRHKKHHKRAGAKRRTAR